MLGKGSGSAHHTVRLDGPTTRLAAFLARRYGVTLQHLVEALLLGCAERDGVGRPAPVAEPTAPLPAATPSEPIPAPSESIPASGKVINLSAQRRRRNPRAQPYHPTAISDSHVRRARAEAVRASARRIRTLAEIARKRASQARVHAQAVKAMLAQYRQSA